MKADCGANYTLSIESFQNFSLLLLSQISYRFLKAQFSG